MNSKKTFLFFSAALVTASLNADTFTWDGGGADSNWQTVLPALSVQAAGLLSAAMEP